jgi:hypothetical protein
LRLFFFRPYHIAPTNKKLLYGIFEKIITTKFINSFLQYIVQFKSQLSNNCKIVKYKSFKGSKTLFLEKKSLHGCPICFFWGSQLNSFNFICLNIIYLIIVFKSARIARDKGRIWSVSNLWKLNNIVPFCLTRKKKYLKVEWSYMRINISEHLNYSFSIHIHFSNFFFNILQNFINLMIKIN